MPEWLKTKLADLSRERIPWNKGLKGYRKVSEEQRANLSKKLMGRKVTDKMLQALAERNQGNTNTLGRKHSEESKELMRLHHNPVSNLNLSKR